MNVGQQGAAGVDFKQGAAGAIPAANHAAIQVPDGELADNTPRGKRDKSELAVPYKGGETWSVRARREGCDVFLSGFDSSDAASNHPDRDSPVRFFTPAGMCIPARRGPFPQLLWSLTMKSGRSLVDLAQELERQISSKRDLVVPSSFLQCRTDEDGSFKLIVDSRQGRRRIRRYGSGPPAARRRAQDPVVGPLSSAGQLRSCGERAADPAAVGRCPLRIGRVDRDKDVPEGHHAPRRVRGCPWRHRAGRHRHYQLGGRLRHAFGSAADLPAGVQERSDRIGPRATQDACRARAGHGSGVGQCVEGRHPGRRRPSLLPGYEVRSSSSSCRSRRVPFTYAQNADLRPWRARISASKSSCDGRGNRPTPLPAISASRAQ